MGAIAQELCRGEKKVGNGGGGCLDALGTVLDDELELLGGLGGF